MAHPFATLLIPAHAGSAPTDRVITRMEASATGGPVLAMLSVTDEAVHVAPADGGPVLAIRLIDLANACLKASGAKHRGDAA